METSKLTKSKLVRSPGLNDFPSNTSTTSIDVGFFDDMKDDTVPLSFMKQTVVFLITLLFVVIS